MTISDDPFRPDYQCNSIGFGPSHWFRPPPLLMRSEICSFWYYDIMGAPQAKISRIRGVLQAKSPLLYVKIRQSYGPLVSAPLVKF